MSNQIQTPEPVVRYTIDGNEIALTPSRVQRHFLSSNTQITLEEFKLFAELCKVNGLNPFLGEAYIIKFGTEAATLVVNYQVFVARADTNPDYDGKESGIIVINSAGEIQERQGGFYLPSEEVVGGWCRVYRKNKKYPDYIGVSFAECVQTKKDGQPNRNWKKSPAMMIEKVATSRALRAAFPNKYKGMYTDSEMNVELPKEDIVDYQGEAVVIEEPQSETVLNMSDLE